MNNLIFKSVAALSVAFTLSGCATIVGKTSYNVHLNTSPQEASVIVTDRKGKIIDSGLTPKQVILKPGSGYFKKAMYSVTFRKPGYLDKTVVINAVLNGWYFGNILFGGVIGMLIMQFL